MYRFFIRLLIVLIKIIKTVFKSKNDLILENLALRQQIATYKAKTIKPTLTDFDRAFWVGLKQSWSKWANALAIVKPETVIDWQKNRFKKYWHELSSRNRRSGRKPTIKEIRELIYQMAVENNWGAPKILSELLMLG